MTTDKAEKRSPYQGKEFWQAYAELYWPDLNSPGLNGFGRQISAVLPERPAGEPIRVLTLGFGFGGVELPVLNRLKHHSGAQIECVAIDQFAEPMWIATQLLKSGLDHIPQSQAGIVEAFRSITIDSGEVVEAERQWRTGPIRYPDSEGDSFLFVTDDLNLEPGSSPCPEPSKWAARLSNRLGEAYRFDMVVAAFSLFHIPWWRRVLFSGLDLLKEGGVFLHARVEGDELFFEGRQGKVQEGRDIATRVFQDTFFNDPRVAEYARKPRGASASRPFVIDRMLHRLESFGLEPIEGAASVRYTVQNRVGLHVYENLLKTEGFSTFQQIAKILKDGEYQKLCDEAIDHAKGIPGPDQLDIDFVWTFHKASSKEIQQFPLHPRFRQPRTSRARSLVQSYKAEYAAGIAASLHDQIANTDNIHEIAQRLGERLTYSDALHPSCLSIQFGFISDLKKRVQYFYAPNYNRNVALYKSHFEDLSIYMASLATPNSEGSGRNESNTKALLETATGAFNRPCLFSYVIGGTKFDAGHRPGKDFEEIRFLIPEPTSVVRSTLDALLRGMKGELLTKREPNVSSLVFSTDKLKVQKTAPEELLRVLGVQVEVVQERFRTAIENQPTLARQTAHRIAEAIRPQSASNALLLQILTGIKMVVFYPATYEIAGGMHGQELVILSYDKVLSDLELEREFIKFNLMFDKLATARVEKATNIRVRQITSHESKHTATALRDWPTRIERERPVLSITSAEEPWADYLKDHPLAVLTYPDLFDNIIRTHLLWTMAGAAADLPFFNEIDKRADRLPLDEYIQYCWASVLKSTKVDVLQRLNAFNPVRGQEYITFLDNYEALFKAPCLSSNTSVPLLDLNKPVFVDLGRMLFCYFREYFQHAKLEYPSIIEVACEDSRWVFNLKNERGNATELKSWLQSKLFNLGISESEASLIQSNLVPEKNPFRPFVYEPSDEPTQAKGKDVRRFLAKRLDQEMNEPLFDEVVAGVYTLKFRLNLSGTPQ